MSPGKRLRETEDFLHQEIPLTRSMEVRVESYENEQLVLTAPLSANHNHLGTAFGGSLAALVMIAGYSLLWLELDDRTAHIVISESTLRFRRPVRGIIRARCRSPKPSTLAAFKSDFAARGKAHIDLEVVVETEGAVAVVFEGTYVAKK